MTKQKLSKLSPDQIGVLSSLLCLLHCLATPFLLVGLAQTTHLHLFGLEFVFLAVSFWAMVQALKASRTKLMSFAFIISYLLLIVGFLLAHYEVFFPYLMHVASLLLVALHYFNLKTCSPARVV